LARHILSKSPLTPLFQIPRNAGLPFVKGGKEGFSLPSPRNYGLTHKWSRTNVFHFDRSQKVDFLGCSRLNFNELAWTRPNNGVHFLGEHPLGRERPF
jgi:hypothetical protein